MATPSKYYDLSLYRNTRYALDIALETYLTNLLFPNDGDRVIYSSTQYAFRKRSSSTSPNLNTLNFPFLNYYREKVTSMDPAQTTKGIWKHTQNTQGEYISELGRKLRFTPISIDYDCTLFYHRDDELQYGFDELIWEDSNSTTIYPTISIDEQVLSFPAFMEFNLDYQPSYNENTALEQNRIRSASLNFNVETVIIKDNNPGGSYCVPEKVIFDFLIMRNFTPEEIAQTDTYEYLINHFDETVAPIT